MYGVVICETVTADIEELVFMLSDGGCAEVSRSYQLVPYRPGGVSLSLWQWGTAVLTVPSSRIFMLAF
jgi:hypothetical protein